MKKKKLALVFVAATFLCASISWVSFASANPDPSQHEIAAARSVWQLMGDERFSFIIKNKDEVLATKVVNAYLNILDPQRIIFLSEDVEKFQRKPMWALAAMQGRALAAPLRIHEIFEERALNRKEWLKSWTPSTNYKTGDMWEASRKEASWPDTLAAQDAIWQRYMDYTYLVSDTNTQNQEKIVELQSERLQRVADLPRPEIIEAFINAYAQSVDPHASYMTPRNAEELMISLTHSLDGIGTILSDREGGTYISEVVPGGPAAKSGKVAVGDRITAISEDGEGWKDVSSMHYQDVVGLIRGKAGSPIWIRLAKGGNASAVEEVSLTRQRIVIADAGAKEKVIQSSDHAIGWIKLPGFYMDADPNSEGGVSAARDVEKSLIKLKEAQVEGVILDLRDNGGGSLGEAVDLVGLFMPPSDVVQIVGTNGEVTQLKSSQTTPVWTGPLVVLVNTGSASASEIAAGALQDHGRAIIVGEKTFGKGTVQSIINLDEVWKNPEPLLGQMKMTVAQFFLPSGNSTQLNGVAPDIEVEATLNNIEGEAQYENAAPAATIDAVKGLSRGAWSESLGELTEGANLRASRSTNFQVWLKLREQIQAQSNRKGFPLNSAEAIRMKTEDENWSRKAMEDLKTLNMDRNTTGVDPVAEVAAGVVADWIDRDVKKL